MIENACQGFVMEICKRKDCALWNNCDRIAINKCQRYEQLKCPYCNATEDIHVFEHGVVEGIYPELKGIKPCFGCMNCRGVWGYK